uniref:Uncharacterized protein n=1 Tax=Polytomella parva TaxID=51329 RepID=A0A7S0YKT8_9CHLO|mmetsp:Transcript_34128/g.61541  ORF Transcript_34128/g.61541 Transcript_34128/m.61541 type:complete len:125 (+) Transcript_34128:80-454(+)
MAWYESIFIGAISPGVNLPTIIILNVICASALGSLLLLLLYSIYYNQRLVIHVVFLIFLALGLWVSINWFVANIGLVSSDEQKDCLFGKAQKPDSSQDDKSYKSEVVEHNEAKVTTSSEKKKEL